MTPETTTPDLVTHLDPRNVGMTIQLGKQAADEINQLHRERVATMAAEIEAMREAIREALAMLLELEYEGNDKGTRCIICGTHCCEPHEVDCAMHQAIQKTKPFLPDATHPKF